MDPNRHYYEQAHQKDQKDEKFEQRCRLFDLQPKTAKFAQQTPHYGNQSDSDFLR
jgi:hypothetical protein